MPAYRGGAFDSKTHDDRRSRLRLQVNVSSRYVWGPVVEKREEINLVRGLRRVRCHGDYEIACTSKRLSRGGAGENIWEAMGPGAADW
jgi:hypothetical protein